MITSKKKALIEMVCARLLYEHENLKVFMAGFKKPEPCSCPGCVAARKLLGIERKD